MRVLCAPTASGVLASNDADLRVALYDMPTDGGPASAGATLKRRIQRRGLVADAAAWDLLSLALSVITADLAQQAPTEFLAQDRQSASLAVVQEDTAPPRGPP